MGLEHGTFCVGCCWALMLLLFAGGVMNLLVILGLTAFVAFEKLASFGRHGARITGGLMVAGGLWMLVH
jgi:predicted metal-binding membrane protein